MRKPIQNILMVDDDADDQLFFKDALKEISESFNCETANNGVDAFKKLEIPPPPDIIFLDLNMPLMNGFECLRLLKEQEKYKNIPVIVYTTTNDKKTIEHIRTLGAVAFFHKPIDFKHLLGKLNKILSSFTPGHTVHSPLADFII